MIKVNQEELQQKIDKLKKVAAETAVKAGGETSASDVRGAKKKVKRAQRKLRSVKAYKSAQKAKAKPEEKASA